MSDDGGRYTLPGRLGGGGSGHGGGSGSGSAGGGADGANLPLMPQERDAEHTARCCRKPIIPIDARQPASTDQRPASAPEHH
ncbi:hypothetical protein OsI_37020 [Oryza sativa Indica Group]|uniref:Uncharacterized protein n=1 Tax=Oryza sativa subsp. indica TaxID=39946 RepID=A2ZGX0_ORYSI|nr:hypothetical protein OsI_37020 [Oryza sativa Indica Group]